MAIADRDYYRNAPATATSQIGRVEPLSVNTWLIILNVIIFIIGSYSPISTWRGLSVAEPSGRVSFATGPFYAVEGRRDLARTANNQVVVPMDSFEAFGHFSYQTAVKQGQIWRFLTFQFLHANITHIAFNMFSLYFFGALIESFLGRGRYLAFYLLSGIGGPLMYIVISKLGLFGNTPPWTPLVGASAGIFGVLIAAASVAPKATVLVYGAIPMQLKTMAYVLIGIAIVTIFLRGNNAGGEAAHLGGAIVGFFLIRNVRLLNWANFGKPATRPQIVDYE